MRPLEEVGLGQRIVLTVIIVLVVLAALSFIGWISGGWEAQGQQNEIPPSKYDAAMIALDRAALDNAYRTQLEHLFAVWLKDETDQPRRMSVGLRQARRAYTEAMGRIEDRERRQ